jgi:hypothetical protein
MQVIFHRVLDVATLKAQLKANASTHRLVSLAGYGHPNYPKFAAIWHPSTGHPTQALLLDCRIDEVPGVIQDAAARSGMMPTIVTTTYGTSGGQSDIRWHFVLEESSVPFSALKFMHSADVDTFRNTLWSGPTETVPDYGVMSFDAIGVSSATPIAYTGLLYPKELPSVARGFTSAVVHSANTFVGFEQDRVTRAMRSGWCRPDIVVPAPFAAEPRLVAWAWRDDVFDEWPISMADPTYNGGAVVLGPFRMSQWTDWTAPLYYSPDWRPWRVAVSSFGYEDPVCCIVYTKRLVPLARSFEVVDARELDPPNRIDKFKLSPKSYAFGAGSLDWGRSPYERWEIRGLAEQRPERFTPQVLEVLPTADGTLPTLGSPPSLLSITAQGVTPARGRGAGHGLLEGKTVIPIGSGGTGGGFPGPGGTGNLPEPGQFGIHRYKVIDKWVRDRLETRGARSAQLAVARGGRLVINRGYTNGELGYPGEPAAQAPHGARERVQGLDRHGRDRPLDAARRQSGRARPAGR